MAGIDSADVNERHNDASTTLVCSLTIFYYIFCGKQMQGEMKRQSVELAVVFLRSSRICLCESLLRRFIHNNGMINSIIKDVEIYQTSIHITELAGVIISNYKF